MKEEKNRNGEKEVSTTCRYQKYDNDFGSSVDLHNGQKKALFRGLS